MGLFEEGLHQVFKKCFVDNVKMHQKLESMDFHVEEKQANKPKTDFESTSSPRTDNKPY